MIDLTIEDLNQLLLDGRQARQYARDHFEELAAREPVYTLYGPYDYSIGAAMPCGYVSKCTRNLTLKTRRKKYIIYELDSKYRLLRTRNYLNSADDHVYHFFELNGTQYACPFLFNKKEECLSEVIAISWKNEKPYNAALLGDNYLFASFYESSSCGKVLVTEYTYHPVSKYTLHGYLTDLNAPINALNSPVTRICREEDFVYTDFSQWFRGHSPVP